MPHVRPRGDGPVAVIHGGGNLLFWGCWRRRWCVLRFAGQSDAFWRNGWFGTSSQKLHTSGSQAGRQAGTNQAGNKTHIEQDIESRGVNQRDLLLHAALLQILPKLSAYHTNSTNPPPNPPKEKAHPHHDPPPPPKKKKKKTFQS